MTRYDHLRLLALTLLLASHITGGPRWEQWAIIGIWVYLGYVSERKTTR